jgi:hypothetical protein
MKHCIIALLLCSLVSLAAQAEDKLSLPKPQRLQGNLTNILIFNHTDKNIGYQVKEPSIFPDRVYQIPMGESDDYRTKFSDENMAFMVGICTDMGHFSCNDYDLLSFVRCTPNKTYNGNLIRSIDVNTLNSCTVTCLDGGTTSCVVTQ